MENQDPKGRFFDEAQMTSRRVIPFIGDPEWTILDVGCKAGAMVAALRFRGYDAWGIEFGENCARYWMQMLSPYLRAYLFHADFLQAGLPNFDMLILSHVIEHVADIDRAMDVIGRITRHRVLCEFPINNAEPAHLTKIADPKEIYDRFEAKEFKISAIWKKKVSGIDTYTFIGDRDGSS